MTNPLALVVDDDFAVRSALCEFLAHEAVDAEQAEDGVKGLDLLKAANADLAFLDLQLPLLDGLSLLKIAKELRPSLAVVMMSGLASSSDIISAMEHGAYAFVKKPWDLERLEKIVREILTKNLPQGYRAIRLTTAAADGQGEPGGDAEAKGGEKDMAIVRWSPFRDPVGIQQEVNRLFYDLMYRRADAGADGAMWIPAVDVAETEDSLTVKIEAPGVKKEDIKISVTNNVLTVRGEKKMEKETSEENYHRIERVYGSFGRSLELPTVVQADKVKASFKDGVLTIVFPKSEEVKPKEIAIEGE
jgi:HSP20 family protein